MSFWTLLADRIGAATGAPFALRERREVGGGCINGAWAVGDGQRRYFVKTNIDEHHAMFAAEAEGLAELAHTQTVRVPVPVVHGVAGDEAFLVLEYLELGGRSADERFGRELAALHRTTAPRFGWHRDNTIGITPQPNAWTDDWIEFLCERRLGHQLDLALARGAGKALRARGEQLLDRLPDLFSDYRPVPSLLHGDLWGGNAAVTRDGAPVIFDPAVYYGDREADLAMTELFGGFGPRFYAAYREAWPLDPGYPVRRDLYNLYHLLNHYNLFGGGYLMQAQSLIDRLLAQLR